ncbi:unnamed protein product [Calicophoron daubneyi]|uniref:Exoribonuclease phosphorolytic domain-containing protein n=1 Tax=Calicophoron daubneyi TaxID=300641 RepID=A0AAV2TF29_CALDB
MERTDLYIELSTDCNAAGSVTWECSGHHVTFSVYGPEEAKAQEELTHRACVDVIVTPPIGQHTLRETELEVFLASVLERLIDVKEFPRTKISGRLCIVSGDASHPRTVAAALNAASLALLQSGLPLRATVTAVCVKIGTTLMAVAVDVTHPQLRGSQKETKDPSVFAVYTGHTGEVPVPGSAGFTPEEFLNALSLPGDFQHFSPNSKSGDQGVLYKQALDIADAMVTQLASTMHVQ